VRGKRATSAGVFRRTEAADWREVHSCKLVSHCLLASSCSDRSPTAVRRIRVIKFIQLKASCRFRALSILLDAFVDLPPEKISTIRNVSASV